MAEESYYPHVASLNVSYILEKEKTGKKPQILLLSHPNNPLGICHPVQVLKESISWAI